MAKIFEPHQVQGVLVALEMCKEEVENIDKKLLKKADEAFARSDQETLKRLLRLKSEMEDFQKAIKGLYERWSRIWNGRCRKTCKKNHRLPKGLCTPQEQFVKPLLETLVELGGRAEVGKVIDLVGEKMKDILNEYDRQKLSSGQERWRNKVQWCRLDLVHKGLINPNSPRGIWEITEAGRAYLKNLKRIT